MSERFDLMRVDIDVACPECGFAVWVRGAEVAAQAAVRCPACRCRIWLIEDRGSLRTTEDDIERELAKIEKAFGEMWS